MKLNNEQLEQLGSQIENADFVKLKIILHYIMNKLVGNGFTNFGEFITTIDKFVSYEKIDYLIDMYNNSGVSEGFWEMKNEINKIDNETMEKMDKEVQDMKEFEIQGLKSRITRLEKIMNRVIESFINDNKTLIIKNINSNNKDLKKFYDDVKDNDGRIMPYWF